MKSIDYRDYYNRVLGGWIGKSLGGIVGAPYECHKQFNTVPPEKLWPDKLYPNDDLDIQVVYLEALQEKGLFLSSLDLAKFWQERCFYVCCEYGIFINNLEHGIHPPLSGTWNNTFQASEGCPIRSEIWGYINPGNPGLAMEYAQRDGCLDHGPVSIEIEQFLSAASALAFFEKDIQTLLEHTCESVPAENIAIRVFRTVRDLFVRYEKLRDVWIQIVRLYGSRDSTDALMNLAIVFLALLKGKNDFKEMMNLCVCCGWDVDCTAATAGALFGAVHGRQALPEDWIGKMGKTLVCAVEIKHQFATLEDFTRETCEIGLEMALSLNREVRIEGAPEVFVRPAPEKKPDISVTYPDGPVLWRKKETNVCVRIENPGGDGLSGKVTILPPEGLQCIPAEFGCHLHPGETKMLELKIRNKNPEGFLHDKNLFLAEMTDEEGHRIIRQEFGLEASRSWHVYGPYWDMWDKDQYKDCPYQNESLACNPGNLPDFSTDAACTHVRLGHPYLDEARLLREEMPEELPFFVEKGGDHFLAEDLCSFKGSACYYLVSTIRSVKEIQDVLLGITCDAPFKFWLDGTLIFERDSHAPPCIDFLSPKLMVTLTGQSQRLVVKIASRLDSFSFGRCLFKPYPTRKSAVSPYCTDVAYH